MCSAAWPGSVYPHVTLSAETRCPECVSQLEFLSRRAKYPSLWVNGLTNFSLLFSPQPIVCKTRVAHGTNSHEVSGRRSDCLWPPTPILSARRVSLRPCQIPHCHCSCPAVSPGSLVDSLLPFPGLQRNGAGVLWRHTLSATSPQCLSCP